ncbi:MAG: ribonuclease P protein component [Planctomycetota bacterium]|nr:ribonuclease P protein component [Planctomycetota bacterium]
MAVHPPVGYRLPRRTRIRARSDYQLVFSRGFRRSTEHLRAVIHPNRGQWSRIGMAVSRKVGNAVVRNRLKRRLREIFRIHREQSPESRDFIFIPRPGCASLSFDDLRGEVVTLISMQLGERHS